MRILKTIKETARKKEKLKERRKINEREKERERERERERQGQRQTDQQTKTETETERDRGREREIERERERVRQREEKVEKGSDTKDGIFHSLSFLCTCTNITLCRIQDPITTKIPLMKPKVADTPSTTFCTTVLISEYWLHSLQLGTQADPSTKNPSAQLMLVELLIVELGNCPARMHGMIQEISAVEGYVLRKRVE